MSIIDIIIEFKIEFLIALSVTLKLTLSVWIIGLLIGIIIGIYGAKYQTLIGIPSKIFTFILGSIPVLIFLYWLHYPFQELIGVTIDGFYTTIFTLSIINSFLVAEQIRSALENFPNQYILSARICGFSNLEIIRRIQIPLITRQILPSILLIQVVMMHSTLFSALISVDELFRIANRINSQIYKPVEIYSALAFFFILISSPLTGIAYWLKVKYSL